MKRIDTVILLTALIAVALVGLNWFSIDTLSSRDWCAQIMAAEKFTNEATRTSPEIVSQVIEQCANTLGIQLESVGWIAKILAIALALSVVAMFLVKFAGARSRGNFAGNEWDIGPGQAAEQVADAAESEAEQIKGNQP